MHLATIDYKLNKLDNKLGKELGPLVKLDILRQDNLEIRRLLLRLGDQINMLMARSSHVGVASKWRSKWRTYRILVLLILLLFALLMTMGSLVLKLISVL
jgi:hypothetical protein